MSGRILIGDALAELRKLPGESVNCVVTSPPYWGLRNYGVAGQLGLEATPAEYVAKMVEVFREVRRVLRADGVLWLNLGDCYATGAYSVGDHPGGGEQGARWRGEIDRPRDDKRGYRGERLANGRGDQPAILRVKTRALRDGSHAGKHTAMAAMGPMTQPNRMPIEGLKPKDLVGIPWRIAFALQADGWWLRSDVVWAKQNPMPESVRDRPTKAHEYLFLLAKSERYHYDADAIREPQTAPEASTSEDVARAFSRRRATVSEPSQRDLEASEIGRKRSGNKERAYRDENGGVADSASHQAFGVPWVDKDGLRNKRSVWTIATQPNPEAHFATFPEALVTPCVLAGCPAFVCSGCGRPIERERRNDASDVHLQAVQEACHSTTVAGAEIQLLQQGLQEGCADEAAGVVRMREVRQDGGAKPAIGADEILQRRVRVETHSRNSLDDQGPHNNDEGLRGDLQADSSERQARLRVGAPVGDGEGDRASVDQGRSGPPQEWRSNGQPAGEPGVDVEARTRPSSKGADRRSRLSALRQGDRPLTACPGCGADLAAKGSRRPGVCLDPFGGTGTVARVAEDLGRHWILIELNPEYAAMAERRMRQHGLLGLIDSPPTPPNPLPTSEPAPAPDGVSAGMGSALGTHGGEGGVGDLSRESQSTSPEADGAGCPAVDEGREGVVGNAPRPGGPPVTAASASPGTVAHSKARPRISIVMVDAAGGETPFTGAAP